MAVGVKSCASAQVWRDWTERYPILVAHFWADWAAPCQQMKVLFAELATQFPSLAFVEVAAEDLIDVAQAHRIMAVPTFIVVKDGKEVERLDGARPSELAALVENVSKWVPFAAPIPARDTDHVASSISSDETHHSADLQARLRHLTGMAPVVLFMKGSPQEPECGFSRQMVSVLEEAGILSYQHFDILQDEAVRQGLKTYANWPTYPQLWIQGELVGGLDIVREMAASGELQSLYPSKQAPDLSAESSMSLSDRLKSLTRRHHVMLFVKGSPDSPRCGFSRQLFELMASENVEYDFFDVLQDEEVRQGLKQFASWPTYPQVYVDGELVGGLDIVGELVASGDFHRLVLGQS